MKATSRIIILSVIAVLLAVGTVAADSLSPMNEKAILQPLGKYATVVPDSSPPDIPNDVWGLENAPRMALGLLVEGEPPGPRLYEVADYLLTFCAHSGHPDSLLLNGTALALIGYRCEGHHPEAELWRVIGGVRLACVGHGRKASLADSLLTDCIQAVCTVAQERKMPVCVDLLALQERLWGKAVDHSRAEHLRVTPKDYARHMIDPAQAENLGQRLRNRAWQYDINIPEARSLLDVQEADDACNNLITLRSHMLVHYQFDDQIDWHLRLFDDKESTVSLASQYFIQNLAAAYAATGQEKYAHHAARLLESFYRLAPAPNSRQMIGPWRSLEVGRRQAVIWPTIIALAGKSDSFTPDIHKMLAFSRLDHMRFATAFPGIPHNWLQVEASGLATAALLSPELRQSEAFLRVAMRRLRWVNSYAFYKDGQQFELCYAAHAFATLALSGVVETARARGVSLPHDFLDLYEKANEVYLYAALPDLSLPTVSDTYSFQVDLSNYLTAGATTLNRPDFLWVATRGAKGTEPDHASHAWPLSGHYVMRDKWGKDGQYLHFDGAPYGANHQHEDKLNFLLYAHGRQLIADPGIYAYSATELTRHFKSSRAHNTILIDGRGQARRFSNSTKLDRIGRNEWVSAPKFDFVSSEYLEGFVPVFGKNASADKVDKTLSQRRAIFYVKPGYWILCDRIQGKDDARHTLEQLFQIAPLETPKSATPYTAGQIEVTGKAIVTADSGLGNIAIIPLTDSPHDISLHKGELGPAAGWWGMEGEIPAWVVDIKTETSLPTRMDAVLYPLAPGQNQYPSVQRLLSDAHTSALRITGNGFDDTFILCEEGTGPVTVGDITFEGRALLVRRQPKPIAYAVAPVRVIVDKKPITPETGR